MGVGRGNISGPVVESMETVVAIVGLGVGEGAVGIRADSTRGCRFAPAVGMVVAIGAVGMAEATVWCVGIGGAIVGLGMGGATVGNRARVVTVTDSARSRGPLAETSRRTVVRERGTVDTLAHGWGPEREAGTRLEAS